MHSHIVYTALNFTRMKKRLSNPILIHDTQILPPIDCETHNTNFSSNDNNHRANYLVSGKQTKRDPLLGISN